MLHRSEIGQNILATYDSQSQPCGENVDTGSFIDAVAEGVCATFGDVGRPTTKEAYIALGTMIYWEPIFSGSAIPEMENFVHAINYMNAGLDEANVWTVGRVLRFGCAQ